MSVVVADTSPLNYLAQCGAIEVLQQLYGLVVIPRAVFDELIEKGAPEAVRSWLDPLPVWISIRSANAIDESLVGRSRSIWISRATSAPAWA